MAWHPPKPILRPSRCRNNSQRLRPDSHGMAATKSHQPGPGFVYVCLCLCLCLCVVFISVCPCQCVHPRARSRPTNPPPPLCSYCQGMNFVAALLLLTASEEDVFWMLVSLVGQLLPKRFYDRTMMGATVRGCMMHDASHMSHVTRHTSHVTRHTSHVTRHTSHVTRHTSHVRSLMQRCC